MPPNNRSNPVARTRVRQTGDGVTVATRRKIMRIKGVAGAPKQRIEASMAGSGDG